MGCLVSVCDHVFDGLDITSTQHNETHGQTNSLAVECRVLEQDVPEFLEDTNITSCHSCNSQTKSTTVLQDLIFRIVKLGLKVLESTSTVVGMDQTIGIQSTTLTVNGATAQPTRSREGGSRREFGPVHSLAKPVEVVTEELVVRSTLVHEGIAECDGTVENRAAAFETVADLCQNAEVEVEGDLVGICQGGTIAVLDQGLQHARRFLVRVEVDDALGNGKIVGVGDLVNGPGGSILYLGLGAGSILAGALDDIAENLEIPGLDGNANHLSVTALLETALEKALDDSLQSGLGSLVGEVGNGARTPVLSNRLEGGAENGVIDGIAREKRLGRKCRLGEGCRSRKLRKLSALGRLGARVLRGGRSNVLVDALGDDGLLEFAVRIKLEQVACSKGKHHAIVVGLEMVVDLGKNQGG
ncbi:unnamed protein product [Clonostachys rosea]|uniref:Uncharacterized protein n=1 Tax=Bionectria ochroleuca TaxID=29856 RepID=A0ABY6V4U7_BIOOC|nr:unnamed protein product [Clonostachys rosea]